MQKTRSSKGFSHRPTIWAILAMTALLTACNGGGGSEADDHAHENIRIDTAGRLAVVEKDAKSLRVHDLDSAVLTVEATHALDHVPSALYASPGGRYAVIPQRLQDQVQFVDGGVWQEDHVDHLHDYRQASRLMAWRLRGVRPTHYDLQAGKQAAVFMDGNAEASPVQNASVHLITETSIPAASAAATLALGFPIHGLAEPVDDKLFAVHRASDAIDTLPTHLDLYRRTGNAYNFERRLPTRCDGMHGSFSAGGYTLAGCVDGVLVVNQGIAPITDRKVSIPVRIGTLAGHPKLGGHFIGIGSSGSGSSTTTRFYAVDAAAGTAVELLFPGWAPGRVLRTQGFDRSGQRFFVLDNLGTLHVLQRQAGTWIPLSTQASLIPEMPAAAPFPQFTANGARDVAYLSDPQGRQVVQINSLNGAVLDRRNVGYSPTALVWLGIGQ